MWIRPAAASTILLPTLGSVAWAERSPVPRVHQAMIEDGKGFTITSSSPTTPNDDPSPMARQVTNSPFIFSRDSFDDEMLLPSSAMFPNSSPSFGPYHHRMQGHGMTRTIFGESGKPIKPRAAYSERHAPRFSNLSSWAGRFWSIAPRRLHLISLRQYHRERFCMSWILKCSQRTTTL